MCVEKGEKSIINVNGKSWICDPPINVESKNGNRGFDFFNFFNNLFSFLS